MTRDALPFYRFMAYVTGVFLILLLAGLVIRLTAGDARLSDVVAPVHGWLYMIYLVATVLLARQRHFTPRFTLLTALAGTVPFASFFAERKVTERARAHAARR